MNATYAGKDAAIISNASAAIAASLACHRHSIDENAQTMGRTGHAIIAPTECVVQTTGSVSAATNSTSSGTDPPTWYVCATRHDAATTEMNQSIPIGSQSAIDFQPFDFATSATIPQTATGATETTARIPRSRQSQFAAKIAMIPSPISSAPNAPATIAPQPIRDPFTG